MSTKYEFICERWPSGNLEKTVLRPAMLNRWQRFTAGTVKVRLRRRGGNFGLWIPVPDALDRVSRVTREGGAGTRIITERRSDHRQLSITKVEHDDVPDLGCAPGVEVIHHQVWERFGTTVRSGGRWYCRFVDGTFPPGVVSYHGHEDEDGQWQGAAEDIFRVEPNTMDGLWEVAEFIVAKAMAGQNDCSRLIVADQSWRPSTGWEHYAGDYHRHVHYQVEGGVSCTPSGQT
jgi:hypothetical protein